MSTSNYITDRFIAFYQHLHSIASESAEFHNMCTAAGRDPGEFEYYVEEDYQLVADAVDKSLNENHALAFAIDHIVRRGKFDVILGEMEQLCFSLIREIIAEVPEACPWPAIIAGFIMGFIEEQVDVTIGQLVGQA